MKNIILSADGDSVVYSVPDIVAENLEKGNVSELTGIACFLGKDSLKKITEFLLKSDDAKGMAKFAMFFSE